MRQTFAQALINQPQLEIEVCYEGSVLEPLLELQPPADLLLLDLDLGGVQVDVEDVNAVMARGTKVLVVSALGSPATVSALVSIGVAGFLSKRAELPALVEAVAAVLSGGTWTTPELAAVLANDTEAAHLSPQERRVLVLYASGLKLEAVAHQLGIRPGTAREYLERIRTKYRAVGRDVTSKTDLYRQAVHDGLIDPA